MRYRKEPDLRALVHSRDFGLQLTRYATKPILDKFERPVIAWDKARWKLDSLCCRQHPTWDDFKHVFFGAAVPTA